MDETLGPPSNQQTVDKPPGKRKRTRWLIRFGKAFIVLVLIAAAIRPFLPRAIRWYVNRTLDQSQTYQGKIGDVHLHLWRGSYSIHDVRLIKVTGNVPVPLFSAKRVDLELQWDALRHGKLVGRIVMLEPELNFVDAKASGEAQTGNGGPWLQIIRDLFPFKINSAIVHGGSVHFRTFETKRPVDVYMDHLEATVDNLTNIRDETAPLITSVNARAMAMGQAPFEYQMKLDPFSYQPTFRLITRLVGLDVTKTNELARAYGAFDFEKGFFDLVIEVDSKEGQATGYIKPLFRNLEVFSLTKDIQQDNVLEFFWEALVGATTQVLKNQSRDQFGTLIPFSTRGGASTPDILATIGNVLRNAFIRAYLPKIQDGISQNEANGLIFEPASVFDPGAAGEQP